MTSSNQSSEDPALHTRIYLTGFMGAGKSTIGKILSRKIGYRFYDTDRLVVKGFGKPVTRIFQENGEPAFRDAELQILHELAKLKKTVISAGGGTLGREPAFSVARNSGTLVYLRAPVEHLFERVIFSPKDRAILEVPDTEAAFRQRFAERQVFYEQADITVDTIGRRPEEAAEEIIQKLGLTKRSAS